MSHTATTPDGRRIARLTGTDLPIGTGWVPGHRIRLAWHATASGGYGPYYVEIDPASRHLTLWRLPVPSTDPRFPRGLQRYVPWSATREVAADATWRDAIAAAAAWLAEPTLPARPAPTVAVTA